MPRKAFRWEYVALSAVLTLAVLSLVFYSYESLGVKKPLEKALLMDPDVGAVDIVEEKDSRVIEVVLTKVADLSSTYTRIETITRERMGEGAYRLQVKDQRDPSLQEIYHSIHYYLEEASARANFGSMNEACSRVIGQSDVSDYKITVDPQHIYVQLEQGEHYLYEVLDRPYFSQGGAPR